MFSISAGNMQPLGLYHLFLQAVSSHTSRAHKLGEAEVLVTASVLQSMGQTLLGSALQVRMLFPWSSQTYFVKKNSQHRQRPEYGLCVNIVQQGFVTLEYLAF